MSEEEHIHSKIATQLLRWGRSDLGTHHGRRTVCLEGWSPGKWYSVEELALAMGVLESDLPLEVLLSDGKHGPRVLHQQKGGRIWIRARWTAGLGGRGHRGARQQHERHEQREAREQRDGARHEQRAGHGDSHFGHRLQESLERRALRQPCLCAVLWVCVAFTVHLPLHHAP